MRVASVVLLVCAPAVAGEPPGWMADHAERMFQRVYARPSAECPKGLEAIGDAASAVCATSDQGIEPLKKMLKRFDDKPNRAVTQVEESGIGRSMHTSRIYSFHRTWRRHGDLHVRDWLEDDRLVVIAFDEAAGLLAVLPKDSCLDPEVRAREDLFFDGVEGFIEAEAVESPLPKRPPTAPNGLAKGGDAVVQFVVDRSGAVGEACVMHSRPGGFGKRALRAIEQWVFAPATIDGEPVDSVVSIAFRWRQRAWDYERTSRYVWN